MFTPAAVIFDMDGLLFDSEVLHREAILAAAVELGHDFTAADFLSLIGSTWAVNRERIQARIGADKDVEEFRVAWGRHYALMRPRLAMKAGVVEILDRLDLLGLPRAICTSSRPEAVAYNLALHGLAGRFDAVVAQGDYAHGKPAPDPYLAAAGRLGIPPARCLALEDSPTGIRAAAAAGMTAVMIPDLLPPDADIRALCHHIAGDLHEVCALLGLQ
jgi:HAD superfamily hydrolase (TIGR01509 family)